MKITKILIPGLAVLAVSVGAGWAQEEDEVDNNPNANAPYAGYSGNLQLIGPGQNVVTTMPSTALGSAKKRTQASYTLNQDLGEVYKFTLVGIEAHADADGVVGWYSWGGYMQTFSEQQAEDWGQGVLDCTEAGRWYFKGGVKNKHVIDGIGFATAKVGYRGSVQQIILGTPKVWTDQTITLRWQITSNSRGIDGYMKILGSIQKTRPVPSGQLLVPENISVGSSPEIGWDINRG